MLKPLTRTRSFGGWVEFHEHHSRACQAPMRFSIYLPPQAATRPVPVLYWLSGLTCTEETFIVKAGAQRLAAEYGLCLVAPDTSPRNTGITGEASDWEVGAGAGFYVNATTPRWAKHFQMYDYVAGELPQLIESNFPVASGKRGISGHSMGGHGALVIAIRNADRYRSVSAFAPICAPTTCPWGEKAFTEFLGPDRTTWEKYDAHLLLKETQFPRSILVDQGTEDKFLTSQLKPEKLEQTCKTNNVPLVLRRQDGYDHSYYFVSTFMAEHIAFHAEALTGAVLRAT